MRLIFRRIFFIIFLLTCSSYPLFTGWSAELQQQNDLTVLQINDQIKFKKDKISNLKERIATYQKNIKIRQSEKASLENQIVLVEDSLAQTNLSLEETQQEIDKLTLEVKESELQIQLKEKEIDIQKERTGELIKNIYEGRERDYFELFLMNDTFDKFFDTIQYLEQTERNLYDILTRLKTSKEQILTQKTSLEQQKKAQDELLATINQEKTHLDEQKEAKQNLIVQSILSAEKFEELLKQARGEQYAVDSEISLLEKTVREKLKLKKDGKISLEWPVDPARGISAYFHDKSYPFRHVFEHPAIDIRAYQGTYIKAAEDGYIGRVKDGGKKGYSYIMILHDQGIATVYGHVSRIMVDQDTYVKKGTIIALSGGTPGTNGAGPLTTGPHLHFEVRVDGIPDDPLKYLP